MTTTHTVDRPQQVDVVIIGAGSAGSVIASRLSERRDRSVVLLEAGDEVDDPDISSPQAWPVLQGRHYDWAYRTLPDTGTGGREHEWPRGRIVGGSSCLHAMAHVRGHLEDFDDWVSAGGPRWSYAALRPFYIRSEHFQAGNGRENGVPEYHGAEGPLPVWLPVEEVHPLTRDFIAAGRSLGVPSLDDHNGDELIGCCANSLTIERARRASVADAYLDRTVRARRNLHIATGTSVERLELRQFSGQSTPHDGYHSLICRTAQGERVFEARRIVIAAGALGSPLLLMRSGIGDPTTLARAGISCSLASRRVGTNLQDHLLGLSNLYESRQTLTPSRLQHSESLMYLKHASLTATSGKPDIVVACAVAPVVAPPRPAPARGSAYALLFGVTAPESRGRIRPSGQAMSDAPSIEPNYLSTERDRQMMRAALQAARTIGHQAALSKWRAAELLPGDHVLSDEHLDAFCAEVASTHHHPCGTCALGVSDEAVVDPDLCVRGLDDVFVVDASVFPTLTSGPINATVVALAEYWASGFSD